MGTQSGLPEVKCTCGSVPVFAYVRRYVHSRDSLVRLTCHGETKWTVFSDNLMSTTWDGIYVITPDSFRRLVAEARQEADDAAAFLRALTNETGSSVVARTPVAERLTILVDNGEP